MPAKPKKTDLYARLVPYNPRLGFNVQRYSEGGRLYQGGVVPRWYKITAAQAKWMENRFQDPNAIDMVKKPLFQIVDGPTRAKIDIEEEQRRMAALGFVSVGPGAAPVRAPAASIDITGDKVPGAGARASAIPQVGPGKTVVSGAAGRAPTPASPAADLADGADEPSGGESSPDEG